MQCIKTRIVGEGRSLKKILRSQSEKKKTNLSHKQKFFLGGGGGGPHGR